MYSPMLHHQSDWWSSNFHNGLMMLVLHSGVTKGAKDQSGARSLDKSLSPSLGVGVADELTIRVGIYLLCLWTRINQNGHL